MKWVILLSLVVLVIGLIAVRYRRQIKMAIYVWRMFRQMRQVGKSGEKQLENPAIDKDVALVRCAKCGTWSPQNKALKLRSGINYCSANCLETAAKVG